MNDLNEIPRGVWMGAEFLRRYYGVTDLTGFKHDPNGWGGVPRYMLPYRVAEMPKKSRFETQKP